MEEHLGVEYLSKRELINLVMDRFDATIVLGFQGGKIPRDEAVRSIYTSEGLDKSKAISFMADSISMLSASKDDDTPELEPFE